MKRKIKGGLTSVSLGVFIADTSSTTGGGLSGVTNSSSGLVMEYRRAGQSSWTSVTPVSKTLGTYTSGGIVADGSLSGAYEVDFPDAAFASGARFVLCRIRGVTNMLPVLVEVELDAVDYQDATSFGLSRIDGTITSRMASYTQPTGFLAATFPATVASTTNITQASGVTLSSAGVQAIWDALTSALTTVGSIGKFIVDRLPALVSGRVPAIVQAYDTGMAPLQPATAGRTLRVSATGEIEEVLLVQTVDELGSNALTANGLEDVIAIAVYQATWNQSWPAGSWGSRLLVSDDSNRIVKITGSKHIAADVHELQPAVINNTHFATGAIDANALATDAVNEIATAVGNLQMLSRLDSMIESDGAGQFRFDTIALSMAPSGGGGGGGTDWTANERTAIRSILGFNSSGSVTDPSVGILDEIRDDVASIGINVYPVSASTPERVSGTTITVYKDEATNVTISTTATLTGLTLRFVAEDREGNDVLVVENAAFIARTATSATVAIPSTLTDEVSNYTWSLRDVTTGNSVLARGVLSVQHAASKDA